MPNHVTSRCRVHGPTNEIKRFKDCCIKIDPAANSAAVGHIFDFDAIIPVPETIRKTYDEKGGANIGLAMLIAAGDDCAPYATLGLYENQISHIRAEVGLPRDAHIRDVARLYLSEKPELKATATNRLQALLETGFTYWYPWAIANWGTKWGSYRFREIETGETYLFQFETACSFPTPIFEKLASDYPLLGFECVSYDEGDNFAGQGWFNPPDGCPPFEICGVTDQLYELAYGRTRPIYDDDDDDEGEEVAA